MATVASTEPMVVVHEGEARGNPNLLRGVWAGGRTFVLVPNRPPAGKEWLDQSLALIPGDYRTGHFVLMTSGATGLPKLVVAKKSRAERLVEVIHSAQENEPVAETIACLPLSYSYAFVNQWLWAYQMRRRAIMTDGLTRPDEFRQVLESAREAMICLVGIQVPLLVSLFGAQTFPGIIRVNFAGGRFPQEQLAELRQIFPHAEVFNNYGCAEAMPRLTIRRAEQADSAANIGRPLLGIELRLWEEDQLQFRSPYRAVAFIEGGTFHALADDDWLATGDLAGVAEDGTWVLLGRKSEVFKRFGEKISLSALQSAIERVWSGELAFYREHDSFGENGHVMVVAPHPPADQLRSILIELRRGFARPHWPLRVESMEKLPHLPNNKIDTLALAQRTHVTIRWSQRS